MAIFKQLEKEQKDSKIVSIPCHTTRREEKIREIRFSYKNFSLFVIKAEQFLFLIFYFILFFVLFCEILYGVFLYALINV